jgi:large repetitive protein
VGVSVQSGIGRSKRGIALGVVCLAVCTIWMSGCQNFNVPISQTNTGTSAGGTITISPAGLIFVDVGRTRQILVTITNDTGNQGVTWALAGPGSLSNITTTTVTYTGSLNSGDTATITATGVANPTEMASASLFIVPLPTIPAVTMPTGTIGTAYNSVVNVTNGAAPYNWSLASGNLPPGITFAQSSLTALTFEGNPACPGGAATCATQTYNFTIQVSDVTSAVAKQSFSITVTGNGSSNTGNAVILKTLGGGGINNASVQGDYAFRFGGFNRQGMSAAAGSFTADGNGNIIGGLVDRTGVAGGPQHGLALTGTYSIGANNLGVMTLNFADGTTTIYAMAVSADSSARFIEFDATTTAGTNGAGDMKKQDAGSLASLKVAGNYVFQLVGVDSQGARMAAAGAFTVNDSGAMSAGVADVNDAGTLANAPFTGNFAQTTAGARTAELDFDPKANTGIVTGHLSLYPVSADEFFAVETDAAGQPLMVGSILRQSAASFTNSSFSGNQIVQATGFAGGDTQMIFGLLTVDSTSGAGALSAAQLSGGGASELNAKYTSTVAANGRVALASSVATPATDVSSAATGAPIVYLVRPNAGFVLGADASVMVGWTQAQAPGAGTITAASFSGTIAGASVFPAGPSMTQSVVSFAFDGKGTVSGTGAASGPEGQALLPILQGTYSIGSGDIFMSVTWPLQNPQPMLIISSGKLIVVPPSASYAPIVAQQ